MQENNMSKLDELERLLQEAKREEAEKNGGSWIGLIFLFIIVIAFARGCSGDKTNSKQEQVPVDQSIEHESNRDTPIEDLEPVKSEEKHEHTKMQVPTSEEKLESITGEKIVTQAEAVEENVVMSVNEQEGVSN